MKKLIVKLLGLETLVNDIAYLKETLDNVEARNEELKNQVKDLLMAQEGLKAGLDEVTEKVDGMEEFDSSQFVSEDEINDRIESYMNDNEYATQCWVEENVNEAVENNIDTESIADDVLEKVRDLFNDASPAPMSKEEIQNEIRESVKVTLEKVVKALADKQG